MNFKSLLASSVVVLSLFATSASAQPNTQKINFFNGGSYKILAITGGFGNDTIAVWTGVGVYGQVGDLLVLNGGSFENMTTTWGIKANEIDEIFTLNLGGTNYCDYGAFTNPIFRTLTIRSSNGDSISPAPNAQENLLQDEE